jgi:hypothetical protein
MRKIVIVVLANLLFGHHLFAQNTTTQSGLDGNRNTAKTNSAKKSK